MLPLPPQFTTVRSRRLFEEVCNQIRAQITSGVLKEGDKLPPERELATQFGISRSAVRAALRNLEFAGLIGLQKGVKGGSFVLSDEMGLVHSFQSMFDVGRLSFDELTEARIWLQDVVVNLAVLRMSDADIDLLDQDVRRTERALADGSAGLDPASTQDFYAILAEATGNRVLAMITRALSQMVYKAILPLRPPLNFDIVAVRERFIVQLRKRNAEAANTIMRDYLEFLHQHIIASNAPRAADHPSAASTLPPT